MERPSGSVLLLFLGDPDHEWPLVEPRQVGARRKARRRARRRRTRPIRFASQDAVYAGLLGALLLLLL